jgi:hypothetical protein
MVRRCGRGVAFRKEIEERCHERFVGAEANGEDDRLLATFSPDISTAHVRIDMTVF